MKQETLKDALAGALAVLLGKENKFRYTGTTIMEGEFIYRAAVSFGEVALDVIGPDDKVILCVKDLAEEIGGADEEERALLAGCLDLALEYLQMKKDENENKEGQPFPFCAVPADESEAAKKKWPFGPTEDDLWRKDYEAARQFAWHAHGLLSMCEKYEAMLSVCGVSLQVPEAKALEALSALRENLHTLTDLKIKKLPHNDVVFMSQPKPKTE